jgi:hypothetical protein
VYHTATASSIIWFQQTNDDIAEIEEGCQVSNVVKEWEKIPVHDDLLYEVGLMVESALTALCVPWRGWIGQRRA